MHRIKEDRYTGRGLPKQRFIALIFLLFGLFLATPSSFGFVEPADAISLKSQATSIKATTSFKVVAIDFQINPIFNAKEATGWIYTTANKLHISTQQRVIERLLTFTIDDKVNQDQLAEAERILRRQAFFREAKVSLHPTEIAGEVVIKVETWDNWTLLPTVDIHREAGVTEYAYGIEDDNFLGLGLLARFQYFSEQERDGYSVKLQSDVLTDFHLRTSLLAAQTTDGEQYQLLLNKPFYTLDDRWAASAKLGQSRLSQKIYSNDEKVNQFLEDKQFAQVSYGFSKGLQGQNVWRYDFGVDFEAFEFELEPLNPLLTTALPQDRKKLVPWLGFEFLQNRFVKKQNLYLIGRLEDIRLGWYHRAKFGVNTQQGANEGALDWSVRSRFSEQINPNNFINSQLFVEAQEEGDSSPATRYYSFFYEHFYKGSTTRTWYGKVSYAGATNPYIDRPLSLGGETGLRGFPLSYQHGDERYLLNLEKRYYPGLNLFKMLDVGFIGFIDIGHAKGETLYPNLEEKTLVSAGVGLKLFLSRSSGRTLINLNLAKPLNSEQITSFDFSVTISSTL